MKFILILPEMWARTLWPFSSSTRNIAFGSGSMTVPSTWTPSSFAIPLVGLDSGEDDRPLGPDRDGVLEVRRKASIRRHDRPLIRQGQHFRRTRVHHGLDRQNHPFPELRSLSHAPVVGHLGLFVELPSDPVSDEGAHDAKTLARHLALDRRRDVGDAVPGSRLRDPRL